VLGAYPLFLLLGLLSSLFIGMIDPIIAVYYIRVVGLGPLELVLLGTIVEIAGLLFEVPTGVVADMYSRRLSVVIGVLLVGACFVVQGLLPVLAAIVVAEALRGVGGTFTSGALEAWIADEIGQDAAAPAYLRYAQLRQVGALVGTVVGVGLGSLALRLPVLLGGVLMVGLGLALAVLMPERGFRRSHHGPGVLRNALTTLGHGLYSIRARPLLGTLIALWLVLALSTEGLDRLWEAHLLAHFAFPTIAALDQVVWFGAINVGFMLLSMLANELVRRRIDLTSDRAVAVALMLTSLFRIAGVVLFGLATSFGLAVLGYLTHMVFRQTSGPLFTGWVNRHVDPRVRATVLSMGGQVDAVGQLTGGPLIGLIAELASLRAAMVAVGLTLVPALPLLARARRQSAAAAGDPLR
jgi:DHA3 family tetracycline resistance protein-like MFS transporter